ncbi:hypothetical protein CHISP_1512 [Chitinispirillum alkaliphilum]|nr:hypothetical protein CHISP_1512 [Chitinispirillum alkaliphilum]
MNMCHFYSCFPENRKIGYELVTRSPFFPVPGCGTDFDTTAQA